MGNITQILSNIKNAVFGKDVRQSIHDGIKQCYDDAIANGHTDMEVAQARGVYSNLNERLKNEEINRKNIDNILQSQIDVDNQRINNLIKLEEGSTTGDAELIDARVGIDGIVYGSTGSALRNQISNLNDKLNGINKIIDTKDIGWESGLWDGYGNKQESATRIRTSGFFSKNICDEIVANNGYMFIVRKYTADSNTPTNTNDSTWLTSFNLANELDEHVRFKLFVKREDNANIDASTEYIHINFIQKSFVKQLDEKFEEKDKKQVDNINSLKEKVNTDIEEIKNNLYTKSTKVLVNMNKLITGKMIKTWTTTAKLSNETSYLGGNAEHIVSEVYPVFAGQIIKSAYYNKQQHKFFYMTFDSEGNQLTTSSAGVNTVIIEQDGYIIFDFANSNLIPEAIVLVDNENDFPYPESYNHTNFMFNPYFETEKPLDIIDKTGGYMAIFHDFGVIGDSLASGNMEGYDSQGTYVYKDFPEFSWGSCIARATGCTEHKFSRGGQFLHDNNWFNEWKDSITENPCLAYIINIGFNDYNWLKVDTSRLGTIADINAIDYTQNPNTFYGQYAKMIRHIKSVQPKAKIFLCNMEWNSTDDSSINSAIAEICSYFDNCYLIDLYTYAHEPYWGVPNVYKTGQYHKNTLGYQKMAWDIMSYIDYIVRHSPEEFIDVQFIGTEYTLKNEVE